MKFNLTRDNAVLGQVYNVHFKEPHTIPGRYMNGKCIIAKATLIGIKQSDASYHGDFAFGFREGDITPRSSSVMSINPRYPEVPGWDWYPNYGFTAIEHALFGIEVECEMSLTQSQFPKGPYEFIDVDDIQVGDTIVASMSGYNSIRYVCVESIEESESSSGEGVVVITGNTYGNSSFKEMVFRRNMTLNRGVKVLLIDRKTA